MYKRLPPWAQAREIIADSAHDFELSNGSKVLAFPTTAGDTYTATLALVDEADLVPDLSRLMTAVKPTIDAGGQMILLSRSDKSRPLSIFKQIYKGARAGKNAWTSIFLPWYTRPDRDKTWYREMARDIEANTGSLDDLHEQYPATDTEALSARTLDKYYPAAWVEQCHREDLHYTVTEGPTLPGFLVWALPEEEEVYVIGADPAEGNPRSDESAATVLDSRGEQVAVLGGRFDPATFASYIAKVADWYNGASVLVERNNHGHTVILWLQDNSAVHLLDGPDEKPGWRTTTTSKVRLLDKLGTALRDGDLILHDFTTVSQLAMLESATLTAPEGEYDDRAIAIALATEALTRPRGVFFA